ncbi:hypothetical protein PAAG_12692 [Paracoccidioides lutzii Pb01]|uniref:Uncharacterized protein n=1 Tax=Paracoccidioides lutzii (strain ATCC MYA-826 / Pb01) TaxID=502779 RepID=A0A0A2V2T4_PARBA|nr:hypothetical protein PAAG_12692 [Paracoccidioides lutzii Pb01]KGQ00652.1 hypothetical protein PAAG_12692 [Paracoccidioides lutzii Pb01]
MGRLVTTRLLDRLHDPLAGARGSLPGHRRRPAEVLGPEAYSYPTTTCGATSPRSGTDSDLEAFSHNPADGSVAALPGQTAAKTNYLNQRFLSSRSLLVGEQSNAYRILLRYDRKSRHRRIKKQRRYERLAATSQLSLW